MSHRNTIDVIHARKDEESRLGLSEAERALRPALPAGLVELKDTQLDHVQGGGFLYWGLSALLVLGINAIKGAEEIGEEWACMLNNDLAPEQCSG